MSKQNRYWVAKTEVKFYVAHAKDEEEALDMIQNKRYVTAGDESERGYYTVMQERPAVSWTIVKDNPDPLQSK